MFSWYLGIIFYRVCREDVGMKCLILFIVGLELIQPSVYSNIVTYSLGKYKPTFRAVCVPEQMIHMHRQGSLTGNHNANTIYTKPKSTLKLYIVGTT